MSLEQLLKDLEEMKRAEKRFLGDFSWNVCDWIFTYLHHHPAKRVDRICDFLYAYTLNELITAECKLLKLPQTESSLAEMKASILSRANEISPNQAKKYAPAVKWAVSLLKQFEKGL